MHFVLMVHGKCQVYGHKSTVKHKGKFSATI